MQGRKTMNDAANTRMHILIATDGSAQALAAARFARTLVNPQSLGRVTVLAVIRPITSTLLFSEAGMVAISQEVWDDLNEAAQASAQTAIQQASDALAGFVPEVDTLIRSGS